jgi:hypothetical protein
MPQLVEWLSGQSLLWLSGGVSNPDPDPDPTSDFLLQESGPFLLLEDGDGILLEA